MWTSATSLPFQREVVDGFPCADATLVDYNVIIISDDGV